MSQGLEAYALPTGEISEQDLPEIRTRIEKVLDSISASGGKNVNYQTIKSSLITFQDWLKAQGCVADASSTYDIGNADGYDDNVFWTYPGQLPFDIVFKMTGGQEQAYRLLLFVTTYELFNFGSLVKNNALEEVFIPEKWPEDGPAWYESRESFF
jgi:hypothetical protein